MLAHNVFGPVRSRHKLGRGVGSRLLVPDLSATAPGAVSLLFLISICVACKP